MIYMIPECHVDEHCAPSSACSVNLTIFDEATEYNGECFDPCINFSSNCNSQTENCFVKRHQPYCVGNNFIFPATTMNLDMYL